MYSLLVVGAFASSAFAQALTFSNTTFTAPVTVGSIWPISFSAGNNDPVAIAFGNTTYAFQIVDGLAAPGSYNWQVAVPVNVVAGTYQLALLQGESDPVFSPAFSLVIPPEEMSSTTDAPTTDVAFPTGTAQAMQTVTAIYIPQMGNITNNFYQTFIYYDEECGCHQTSTCESSAMPTSTSMTTVTYSAEDCGCTTTVTAPCAETVIPVMSAAATNVPVAPTSAPAAPAATSAAPAAPKPVAATSVAPQAASPTQSTLPTYTGAASKLAGTSFGFLAAVAALVMA